MYFQVPELASVVNPYRGESGKLGWGTGDDPVSCEAGGLGRPECLPRATTLLVTVGTTVVLPVSVQLVDVVADLR